MYLDGIMRAFSVGFMDEENGRNQLLEISAVSVPANANALVFSKSVSEQETEEVNKWIEEEIKQFDDANNEELLRKENEELKHQLLQVNEKLNSFIKIKDRPISQDNSNTLLVKGLEKISNQLGYLQRKVK